MSYFHRKIEGTLMRYLKIFPAIGLTGPRQSGKSTTLKTILGEKYEYITFDDPILTKFFQDDPKGFMERYKRHIIFDEVQKVPELFSYIKIIIDNNRDDYGRFILTGSSQFSLIKNITESLAGRIGLLSLLPFEITETPQHQQAQHILCGGYPELISRKYFGWQALVWRLHHQLHRT